MNCANHPETPVSAYCQVCGKPLCQECVRNVGGVVYCEPCLTARVNAPSGTPGAKNPTYVGLPASGAPNPALALGLGFIPGVGAMYNGQFVKGLAHVFVFALLCSFSAHESFFGILIPFWIAYQVFDAYQTARARLYGTPLPNPFGLNDLGHRLGFQQHPEGSSPGVPPAGTPAAGPSPSSAPYQGDPATGAPGASSTYVPPASSGYASGFVPGGYAGGPPPPAYGSNPIPLGHNDIPTGAIVLIGLGVLFLLGSLGIFHEDWIGRGWPVLIVGVGVWLVIRRTRESRLRNGNDGQGGTR